MNETELVSAVVLGLVVELVVFLVAISVFVNNPPSWKGFWDFDDEDTCNAWLILYAVLGGSVYLVTLVSFLILWRGPLFGGFNGSGAHVFGLVAGGAAGLLVFAFVTWITALLLFGVTCLARLGVIGLYAFWFTEEWYGIRSRCCQGFAFAVVALLLHWRAYGVFVPNLAHLAFGAWGPDYTGMLLAIMGAS